MEVSAGDNKLRTAIEDQAACKRQYGMDMSKKIALRIAALQAADRLADFWPPKSGPELPRTEREREGTFQWI